MIEPGRYDITIHQGATFLLRLQYRDSQGTAVNMTGYTVAAKLYNRNRSTQLAVFETPWETQTEGKFNLKLSADTTKAITEPGEYDVLVTEPSGNKFYLLEGTALWNPGITGL